jgi:hypothetical protein
MLYRGTVWAEKEKLTCVNQALFHFWRHEASPASFGKWDNVKVVCPFPRRRDVAGLELRDDLLANHSSRCVTAQQGKSIEKVSMHIGWFFPECWISRRGCNDLQQYRATFEKRMMWKGGMAGF